MPPHRHPDLDPLDRLRHDLYTPLTIISGRAQLLARGVRRSASLAENERVVMLVGLAAIDGAILALVAAIDGIDRDRRG